MSYYSYIGKATNMDDLLNAVIDDLKIFSKGLDQTEILNEMNVKRPLLN